MAPSTSVRLTPCCAGTPGLPEADRADDEAKQQRELHLDALIAHAKELLGDDWAYVHQHALSEQLADCRDDLEQFGVHFDVWFSEKALYDTGLVARCVDLLEKKGHLYVQNGAKWFSSTAFGDEKDRVVQRENGLYTYFASDIAYHLNKFERGFDKVINIWGADHHGYIPRVERRRQGARSRRRQAAGGAGPVRRALPQRPEGLDVHALRRVRHAARTARAKSATTPAASSTCCASPTSTSISTSTWPRARPTRTRSITSSTPMPASAR